MSDLYFNEASYYFEENTSDNEIFTPLFLNHFSLSLNIKKRVVMRAMRKMLKLFTLQLLIYYIIRIGIID